MCGRFSLSATPEEIQNHYRLQNPPDFSPRYNIAPTQEALVVYQHPESLKSTAFNMHWGLVPSWSKDSKIGSKLINARQETLSEKPSFRAAFKKRRCLIPASGFYEWDRETKYPYYFSLKGGRVFSFAGLWEGWQSPEGEKLFTFTIITTDSNSVVGKIHDRMPVIIHPEQYGFWLSPVYEPDFVKEFCKAYDPLKMKYWKVSRMVNNPQNEGEGCIKKVQY